jgi:shikimate kinase
MKKFIMISGPMGVGKSVTGKLLCDNIGRAAFIDGDWCLDIHPFIGNRETVSMAIDNIIHMTRNYYYCSECDTIVLSWVISEDNINKIISGLTDLNINTYSITLVCDADSLIDRWNKDKITEWRTDEWLKHSIKSISSYKNRTNTIVIDTSCIDIPSVVNKIVEQL